MPVAMLSTGSSMEPLPFGVPVASLTYTASSGSPSLPSQFASMPSNGSSIGPRYLHSHPFLSSPSTSKKPGWQVKSHTGSAGALSQNDTPLAKLTLLQSLPHEPQFCIVAYLPAFLKFSS